MATLRERPHRPLFGNFCVFDDVISLIFHSRQGLVRQGLDGCQRCREWPRLRGDQAVPGHAAGDAPSEGEGAGQALPFLVGSGAEGLLLGTAVEAAERHKFARHLKAWGDAHTAGNGIRFICDSDAIDDPDCKGFWTAQWGEAAQSPRADRVARRLAVCSWELRVECPTTATCGRGSSYI